jgi:uncharacterized protein YegP (UPF0339 family)
LVSGLDGVKSRRHREIIAASQGYATKEKAHKGIESVKASATAAKS